MWRSLAAASAALKCLGEGMKMKRRRVSRIFREQNIMSDKYQPENAQSGGNPDSGRRALRRAGERSGLFI